MPITKQELLLCINKRRSWARSSGRTRSPGSSGRSDWTFIPLTSFRSLGSNRTNFTLNALWPGYALRPHGSY